MLRSIALRRPSLYYRLKLGPQSIFIHWHIPAVERTQTNVECVITRCQKGVVEGNLHGICAILMVLFEDLAAGK